MAVQSQHLHNGEVEERPRRRVPRETHAANTVALVFWAFLWFLNGITTVLPFILLGWRIDASRGMLGILVGIGIVAHVVTSLVENHLWRSFSMCDPGERLVIGGEIFTVGFIDVLSATMEIFAFFRLVGIATYTWPWYTFCVLAAEGIAIGSEPMIRLHRKLMRR